MSKNRNKIFSTILFFLIAATVTVVLAKIPTAFKKAPLENPFISASDYSVAVPPAESLSGQITKLTGNVSWKSRTATSESRLTEKTSLVQGSSIHTKDSGLLTVQLSNIATISALPKTNLSFIQTLPQNLVIGQDSGDALYTKSGKSPLSVRSNEILINLNSGKMEVTVSRDSNRIYVDVISGNAQIAYNDRDTISNVVPVEEGYEFIFDEDSRTGRIVPHL